MRRTAFLLLTLLGPGVPAASPAPPDVVLVTLDTVRADRMGFLGSTRGLTPALDALAREGVVFEQAFAQAPLTTVSHATILSGTHPPSHGVRDFGMPLPAGVPWLPAALRAGGYRTAAFVGSIVLDPKGPIAPGFDRGFDTYDAGFRRRRDGADPYATKERRGGDVVARALSWLDRSPRSPVFLWVHLFDAHDPYDPPAPFAERFPREPYDGEIAAVDAAVSRLLAGLRHRRHFDGALVVAAGDHGESLGEHGEDTHGVFLYDATIRVPLVVRLPRGEGAGRRVASRVGLVDVAPTVLEVVGLATPPEVHGRSLTGSIRGTREPERPSYAESEYPRRVFGWSSLASWRAGRFLFVEAPRPELYAARDDPGATRNLAGEDAPVAAAMAAELEKARRAWTGANTPDAASPADPELVERLVSLGYAAAPTPDRAARPSGIDPKDKVEVTNLLHDASLAAEEGRWDKAIALYERVVATDPQIFTARLELGLALARRGRWASALPHLKTIAEREPGFADARFTLGLAYASLGRREEAVAELRAAIKADPRHRKASELLQQLLEGRSPPAPRR
jgi:arylsulfatase A-like enzyme